MILIGVDPHKGSHTAVAIDGDETQLGRVQVRADRRQLQRLLDFASAFEWRTWAVEAAAGNGYLLAQQLVGAGETVVDVPAKLASRVAAFGVGQRGEERSQRCVVHRWRGTGSAGGLGPSMAVARRGRDLGGTARPPGLPRSAQRGADPRAG